MRLGVEEMQMNIKYIVELSEDERNELIELTRAGNPGARKMKRAQILLMADNGATVRRPATTTNIDATEQRTSSCSSMLTAPGGTSR